MRTFALRRSASKKKELASRSPRWKFGQTIFVPAWFVLDGEKLYLLSVQGSDAGITLIKRCKLLHIKVVEAALVEPVSLLRKPGSTEDD